MTERLPSYRGPLSPAQLAEGINAARENATRLAEDAQRLFDAGRSPSALALAALAIEEAGKISILRGIALAQDEEELRAGWKDYRAHTRKNVAWLFPQLVAQGGSRLEDFRELFDPSAEHPYVLDNLKQLAFYTDCLGSAHWSKPVDVIDKALASSLVSAARLLPGTHVCTAREIELWIEHLGPVWRKDMSWMKQALVNWYAALHKEGLATGAPSQMQDFVFARPAGEQEAHDGSDDA